MNRPCYFLLFANNVFGWPEILGNCSSIYSQFHYSCRLPGGKLFIEEILIRATIPTWAAAASVLLSKKKHVTVLASVAAPPCEKVVEQMILPCQPPPCNPSLQWHLWISLPFSLLCKLYVPKHLIIKPPEHKPSFCNKFFSRNVVFLGCSRKNISDIWF